MANFYRDNDDIRFLMEHIDLAELAEYQEDGFRYTGDSDWAPANADEAVENYKMVVDTVGQLSGDFIDPRSEGIDHEGNTLNEDGSVSYAKGIAESLDALSLDFLQ